MSHLDEVIRNIDKYRGPGYEVKEKIMLQHGTGVIIGKKRTGVSAALVSHSDLIFLYSVDGDATVRQMIEFLEKSWEIWRRKGLKEAIFVPSGNVDEKGFDELKKKTIKNKKISESIRVLSFGKDAIEGKEIGTKTTSVKHCAYCGASLPPAAQFCPNCAAKVE